MKNFLITRNINIRLDFIKKIKGKTLAIYNGESELLNHFEYTVDMHKLMNDEYFLTNLPKCDGNTTVVLIDILIKHGVYVHPYGKVFKFCENAKHVIIIDTFAFKWDEKQIVRPFLFINPSLLGASLINFFEGKENTIENYFPRIKEYLQIEEAPINIITEKYTPTESEIIRYNKLKEELIGNVNNPKNKIVNELIKFVDASDSKKTCIAQCKKEGLKIISNKPKTKFDIYENLRDESINTVIFFSSGFYGADEIELNKTRLALERHNLLINLYYGNKNV